ncbi:MAG: ATP-binding protein, partial [Phormidesmis sp.]
TYTVSHDLRAPLRAMQGFAQALLEDNEGQLDTLGHEYAERIIKAAAQMDGLILDLLEYSRLSRKDIRMQSLNLTTMMSQACSTLSETITRQQADIQVESPLLDICGNHQIVQQILVNLLTNGLKFVSSETRPKLHICCEEKDGKVRLWVKDNGLGIAPEHQQRIFRVFERLHGIENYVGTGIGLAIVKRGIQQLGGDAGVESAVGQGSQFWVDFIKA